jgi:hypothetical protein
VVGSWLGEQLFSGDKPRLDVHWTPFSLSRTVCAAGRRRVCHHLLGRRIVPHRCSVIRSRRSRTFCLMLIDGERAVLGDGDSAVVEE